MPDILRSFLTNMGLIVVGFILGLLFAFRFLPVSVAIIAMVIIAIALPIFAKNFKRSKKRITDG